MSRRVSFKEVQQRIKDKYGENISIISDETKYKGTKYPLLFKCNVCGNILEKTPNNMFHYGCKYCCKKEKTKRCLMYAQQKVLDLEIIRERVKKRYGDEYVILTREDEYCNTQKHVNILHTKCGREFKVTPRNLLAGYGCSKCAKEYNSQTIYRLLIEKNLKSKNNFKDKVSKLYNNKISVNNEDYIKDKIPLNAYCIYHGVFKTTPNRLLHGSGCPKCLQTKLERTIERMLLNEHTTFDYQRKFQWLGLQKIDFYLPEYNVAIECQGKQHFKPVEYFGGDIAFKRMQELDKRKYDLCKEHNVKLLYYAEEKEYDEFLGDKLYKNTEDLINEIKSYGNETTDTAKYSES